MFKRLLTIIFFSLAILTLTACDETNISVYTMLNNQSSEPYYIWIGHGEPTSSDLVAPGQFRQIMVTVNGHQKDDVPKDISDRIFAHASKNLTGQPSIEELWANFPYEQGKQFYIRWDGKGFSLEYR